MGRRILTGGARGGLGVVAAAAVVVVLTAVAARPAHADERGTITGTVVVADEAGRPVGPEGAIVYVVGFVEPAAADVPKVVQKDKKFQPELVAITAGQRVEFPNADAIFHNVFSRSPTRRFDLGQFKRGESKEKSFPTAGVVDVYCNIHPEMAATILVLPNRRHARVGADGHFTITGVPAGTWTVFAYTRLAVRPVSNAVTVRPNEAAAVSFALIRGRAVEHVNKYGEKYRDPKRYR